MEKDDFQLSFFSESTPSFFAQEQPTYQSEPYDRVHKLRRLNSEFSYDNSQISPQNFSRGSYTEVPTQENGSSRPEKTVIKSAYKNPVQNHMGSGRLMMMKGSVEKLPIPPAHMHQVQLEKMKQLSHFQEKELETHLQFRRRISLSTTSCSPNNSVKGSFNCTASPGSEEETRPALLNIVSATNKEENITKDTQPDLFNPWRVSTPEQNNSTSSFGVVPINNQSFDNVSQANQIIPSSTMNQNDLIDNQSKLVNFSAEAQTSLGQPPLLTQVDGMYPCQHPQTPSQCTPSYMQMQRQISEPSQLIAQRYDSQNSGNNCRSLVNDQMKAIQSLVLNKRSHSQMAPDQYTRHPFSPYNSETPTLQVQRTMSGGPVQNPNNNESVNKMLLQRWNLQRAMQYRFALQQKSYYMMQQKLLMQNNPSQATASSSIPANQQASFLNQVDQNRVSPIMDNTTQVPQETGTIDNIDKFFQTSNNVQNGVSRASEKRKGSYDLFTHDSKFLDVDHFLTSFPDDMLNFEERVDGNSENIAPLSSKDTLQSDRLF